MPRQKRRDKARQGKTRQDMARQQITVIRAAADAAKVMQRIRLPLEEERWGTRCFTDDTNTTEQTKYNGADCP
jgi:hypothetical protein